MIKPLLILTLTTVFSLGDLYIGLRTVAFAQSGHVSATTGKVAVSNQSKTFTQVDAIAEVNKVLGTTFPDTPSKVYGSIGEGGPVGRWIPAFLQTQVQRVDSRTFLVTFTEQWSSIDLYGMGSTNKGLLEHHWTYKVTPKVSTIVSSGGDFPPQAVR